MISDPVPELETDCEILWVKINLVGVNTLLVGVFYRPNMKDRQAIKELKLSLQRLNSLALLYGWHGILMPLTLIGPFQV